VTYITFFNSRVVGSMATKLANKFIRTGHIQVRSDRGYFIDLLYFWPTSRSSTPAWSALWRPSWPTSSSEPVISRYRVPEGTISLTYYTFDLLHHFRQRSRGRLHGDQAGQQVHQDRSYPGTVVPEGISLTYYTLDLLPVHHFRQRSLAWIHGNWTVQKKFIRTF
jgi:hypothetical protein